MPIGVIRLIKKNKKDMNMLKNFYNSLEEEKTTFQSPWDSIKNPKLMIINEYEGKIIAICGVNNEDKSFTCVKKEFQGRGIGKRLYPLRLKYCKKMGIKKVKTSSSNPISQHLLEKTEYKKLYRVDKNVYYELSLSNILKITFPIRRIVYLLYGFWRNLTRTVKKKAN